ncbi:hypothetical protein PAXINDRAFT_13215 [Paxillus involutus ATCC 200175]|uniref:Uncharacterized protein n=1 Tax=Paxillus involutus ATCC 200175 TaxID=664439 RepID=A0A0C9SWF3_PAXIN|nr:hypothetical protein PAXINDRAFT_13215 [Paxillus involutus ATCC 200175]
MPSFYGGSDHIPHGLAASPPGTLTLPRITSFCFFISSALFSTEARIIPSPDALNKLRKREYCELYYFTDLGESSKLLSTNNDAPSFSVPLPSPKAKESIIKDEDLTWGQFTQAHPRMAAAMRECGWPEERAQTLIDFWMAIESSDWCHDGSSHSKRALLIYQGRVRKFWHSAVGMPSAFSLPKLNQKLLLKIRGQLINKSSTSESASVKQVC